MITAALTTVFSVLLSALTGLWLASWLRRKFPSWLPLVFLAVVVGGCAEAPRKPQAALCEKCVAAGGYVACKCCPPECCGNGVDRCCCLHIDRRTCTPPEPRPQ